ncbi:MAG: bifunctional (p)ppGpp synthetase/guanosine-3',5'-bis(diphosphate) 3'-pyrophosphohydrolase [Chitinophagales bacterium]|nr:bifunctional (p)ppGpp synthetase/guanosine-3',5'-bis(diphosphate) 3'-pyrophosphohydrolase [Chitinophagales bacterium]
MPGSAENQEVVIPVLQEDDRPLIISAYRNLLRAINTKLNADDQKNIRAAFELATRAHMEQRRKSGEPYILHPIEVARICVEEIGLGPTAVVCALLHDVVEDTNVTLKDIHDQFGERVMLIVDGLTKLDSLHETENPQAENLYRVLKAMLSDVRVVLIKMADRLHNLRTIGSMPAHKQLRIAAETATVYAPLAHRLGLYAIKSEFQDLCLKITDREAYDDIADKLAQTKTARQEYISAFIKPIAEGLENEGIKARVFGRPKTIHSIYNKIQSKNVAFEEIYDLFAIRIILQVPMQQEKFACWQAYTLVTDTYKPIPERLKDWITSPKANGYESLHTTVAGPDGKFVEVQIRSERMDEIAERGFAAHWKYKGVSEVKSRANTFDNWLNQVRETLESENAGNAVEFLADFQTSNLYSEEIHVFTPKGEMRILPEAATALDFAFSIHSDLGCMCRSVMINGQIKSIYHKLQNGDQVRIMGDRNQKPSEDWLKHVVTSKARSRIRAALKEEKRKLADDGREILERKLNAMKMPSGAFDSSLDTLMKWYGFPNRLDFLAAIYTQQVDLAQVHKNFRNDGGRLFPLEASHREDAEAPLLPEQVAPARSKPGNRPEVIINGDSTNYPYTMAQCCNPVQGDDIFAFLTIKDGVKIHRKNCPNANNLLSQYAHRVMKAEWGNTVKADFVVTVVITGVDTGPGVIQQLTNRISEMGINIRSFNISGDGGYFEGIVKLVISNTDQLNRAMTALKSLEWVSNVRRTE